MPAVDAGLWRRDSAGGGLLTSSDYPVDAGDELRRVLSVSV